MKCKQCGKEIDRGKWCSDKCRMANKRRTENPNKPEHEQKVEQAIQKIEQISVIPSVTPEPIPEMPKEGVGFVSQIRKQTKRGLEIQNFEDLPEDVQADIEMMSHAMAGVTRKVGDGEYEVTYESEKALRTSRAVNYQHVFPGRF